MNGIWAGLFRLTGNDRWTKPDKKQLNYLIKQKNFSFWDFFLFLPDGLCDTSVWFLHFIIWFPHDTNLKKKSKIVSTFSLSIPPAKSNKKSTTKWKLSLLFGKGLKSFLLELHLRQPRYNKEGNKEWRRRRWDLILA